VSAVRTLLIAVAILGALDTFWHHEWRARLPSRPGAQRELRLHAVRDFAYGALFVLLGWGRPQGALAWGLAALLLLEIVVTLTDFVEEDRVRPLEPAERILHSVIAIVYGAFLAVLAPRLVGWVGAPTGYALEPAGLVSWLLAAMAVGVAASGARDLVAARRLDRAATRAA
jgi:hypothetical protein